MEKFIKLNTTDNGPVLINADAMSTLKTRASFDSIVGNYGSRRQFQFYLPQKVSGSHTPVFFLGTATGHASNKVIDSTANFTSTVQVGDIVENVDTTTQSFVTAIDSDFQLTIHQNGLWSPHVNYKVIKNSILQDTSADFINDGVLQVGDVVSVAGGLSAIIDSMTATTLTLGGYQNNAPTGFAYAQDSSGNNAYNSNLSYAGQSYAVPYMGDYSVEKAIKNAIIKSETNRNVNNLVEVITKSPITSVNI